MSAGTDKTLGGLMELGQIHPTAIIAKGANLGKNVTIGPYAIIENHTEIGDDTIIETHAVIRSYTKMGARNHVYPHAIVGGDNQDLKFHGEETWLIIGNDNSIREFSTSHRGTEGGKGVTTVGDRNLLMAYTHIAHDCVLGSDIVMSNNASLAGHVEVGDHAIIAGMSGVHQFARIGDHAFIGGMSGVNQDVPPWMLALGIRAIIISPNLVGMRRANLDPSVISAIKATFQILAKAGTNRSESLSEIEEKFGSVDEVAKIVKFIRESERGISSFSS